MRVIKFLPHQKRVMESTKREVIQSGAFGSGKTFTLCSKLVFLSLKYPKNRGYLCRHTLQKLKATTLITLLEGDGDTPPVLPRKYIKGHNKTDRVITLYNGSEIWYGPMDQEFIKSMNLGWAAVDELSELNEDDWVALQNRLRLANVPVRQVFAATNPNSAGHWIFKRAVKEATSDGSPIEYNQPDRIEFVLSKTVDNPYLPQDYIKELERTLFGHLYKRYVLGLWAGSGKLIYDNFDARHHVIPNFDIPKTWKRFRAVDFGFTSPFVCHWYAIVPNAVPEKGLHAGDVVLYREYYYSRRVISLNAQKVKDLSIYSDGTPEKIVETIADWDSGDRAELESKGIKTRKANKDISSGIQKVREFLGNTDPGMGTLIRPRFYVLSNISAEYDPKLKINPDTGERENNPTGIVEEFQTYSWRLDKAGKTLEEPDDNNNHSMDTVRMFLNSININNWRDIKFLSL